MFNFQDPNDSPMVLHNPMEWQRIGGMSFIVIYSIHTYCFIIINFMKVMILLFENFRLPFTFGVLAVVPSL